jgi:hypothetical protein
VAKPQLVDRELVGKQQINAFGASRLGDLGGERRLSSARATYKFYLHAVGFLSPQAMASSSTFDFLDVPRIASTLMDLLARVNCFLRFVDLALFGLSARCSRRINGRFLMLFAKHVHSCSGISRQHKHGWWK